MSIFAFLAFILPEEADRGNTNNAFPCCNKISFIEIDKKIGQHKEENIFQLFFLSLVARLSPPLDKGEEHRIHLSILANNITRWRTSTNPTQHMRVVNEDEWGLY